MRKRDSYRKQNKKEEIIYNERRIEGIREKN